MEQPELVKKFIRMWPRAIFNTPSEGEGKPGKPRAIARTLEILKSPGVYILYRDDQPFYVGQAKNGLRKRIWSRAQSVESPKSYFWNYFSAYVVDVEHIDEVEAILIAAMPAVLTNSATPRLERVKMDKQTRDIIRVLRKDNRY